MNVYPDGALIRARRSAEHWTQEDLAVKCRLAVRTIQRAEAGDALLSESLAFIADALSVNISKLVVANESASEEPEAEGDLVVLRKTASARVVVEGLVRADNHVLEYDVDPTEETADAIVELIGHFEQFDPYQQPPVAMQLSERIRATATIHKRMAELERQGVFVFYGQYVASGLRSRYDPYEGGWYTKGNQHPEPLKVSIVVISDNPAAKMTRRADDKKVVPAPIDEEIPF
jgi:transcriptional regulator with XRE-family HTH domain